MERAQALLNYLTTKPYQEVAGFVQFLVEAQPHGEDNAPADDGPPESPDS
jgi:hypothetical protein